MTNTAINLNREFSNFVVPYKKGDNKYFIPSFPQYFYTKGIRDIMQQFELYDLLEIIFPFFKTNPAISAHHTKISVSRVPEYALNYCVVVTNYQDKILFQERILLQSVEFDSLELILSINKLALPEELSELNTSQSLLQ